MNPRKTTIAILATLSAASLALADDFKTINGKEYKNATVTRVESDGVVITFHGGMVKIYFVELPKDVQRRFGYDADKIEAVARAAEEKRIEEQKAAERERAEREKGFEADMKQSAEKFKAVEERAKQTYQNGAKGTLSGQVFVSTAGGNSVKLGGVQVQLFAREAIDIFVAAIKKYGDVMIPQVTELVAGTKTAFEQAEARVNAARGVGAASDYGPALDARAAAEKARDTAQNKLNYVYSGAFYFDFLHHPIQTVETDADGKFAIEVPKAGSFVIAAKAERYITQIDWKPITEHYYWLQPVSLEGQPQRVQNLSNNNLTSTTGSSSLIHTQD